MELNRITSHADTVQTLIDTGGVNGALGTPAKLRAFERDMDISLQEHAAYQNAQARAHASGTISPAEAMVVYRALGEARVDGNGGWATGTPLALKVTVTNLKGQLVTRR